MGDRLPRKLVAILYADVADYSRLTGEDEDATHRTVSEFLDVIARATESHRGKVMHYAGDAVLATFDAVLDAVSTAVEVQTELRCRNVEVPDECRVQFRIGVNLGDVIEDRGDVYGDGVNVAARLESLAEPGGIRISESVHTAIGNKLTFHCEFMGEQSVKNIASPIRTYRVLLDSSGRKTIKSNTSTPAKVAIGLVDQSPIRYCTSDDGTSIAHAQVGCGEPVVFGGSWMTHLERDWENYGHYISGIAEEFTVIRYDQRGNGLSDWENVDISFEKMVDDLRCVIDCYEYDKVSIIGGSQAASVAVAYAVEHPERVFRLVLYGGYPRGRRRRGDPEAVAESEALVTLIRQGWGRDNPAYRQTMTSVFMPGATQEQQIRFNDFQKACGPAENIARFREVFDEIDITDLLERVCVPTLVIHCAGDSVAPLSEGKLLASRIPAAQFVTLQSGGHMILEDDPEFPRSIKTICDFLR